MELFVCAILLTVTGAQESQLEGPQNAVSVVGSNVTLKCLSPSRNCSGIDWIKFSHGSPMTVFRDRGGISIAYRGRYGVENNSPGCGLIIGNVQLTDAGRFLCRASISSSSVEKSANLIILENESECMANASENITAEGDGVHLTCEVTHIKTYRASMVWNGVKGTTATVTNGKTISRSDSFVASAPEVPSFTCITSFSFEYNGREIISGLATNSPVTTFATPTIKVLYSVRDVQLSPTLFNYSPGSRIACMARGHPSPTLKWQEMENDGTWMDIPNQNGCEFSMTDVSCKRYRCFAMNVVRGKSYSASSPEFLVNNTDSDKICTSTSGASASEDHPGVGVGGYNGGGAGGVIGVGTGISFGIGFLAAIVLGSIAFAILIRLRYLEFHPKPANKPLDGVVQQKEQEINPSSSHQLSVMHPSTHRIGAPVIGEQESAYASLGEGGVANEYEALELRQKARKTSRP